MKGQTDMADREIQGQIQHFNKKGYGFIRTVDGVDYFFHISDLLNIAEGDLQVGIEVSFTLGMDRRGQKAINISRKDVGHGIEKA